MEQYRQSIAIQEKVIDVIEKNTEVIAAFVEVQHKTNSIITQHYGSKPAAN